jgi:hypothetical protein
MEAFLNLLWFFIFFIPPMNPITRIRHGTWNIVSFSYKIDTCSKQDGLVWGNSVTSIITRPTLKPFSNTQWLTRTTRSSRPNIAKSNTDLINKGYLCKTFIYLQSFICFSGFFFIIFLCNCEK